MKDILDRKELVRTNFGPEEDDKTYQQIICRALETKNRMRDELLN
jgi:hypothetical protein